MARISPSYRRCAARILGLAQGLALIAGTVAAAIVPNVAEGGVHLLDFAYDQLDDVTVALGDVVLEDTAGWRSEHATIRAADGRPFTIGYGSPQGIVSVFTDMRFYITQPGEPPEPPIFYLEARLNGSVVQHHAFAATRNEPFFLPGLYDEIRFGKRFPMGLDPALSARDGWYDRPRDLTRFLGPGQIGCWYFDCYAGGWVYFWATDPANGARPEAGDPPAAVPLPGAAPALLAGMAALIGLRRRAA